jgi:hypothetical protein
MNHVWNLYFDEAAISHQSFFYRQFVLDCTDCVDFEIQSVRRSVWNLDVSIGRDNREFVLEHLNALHPLL